MVYIEQTEAERRKDIRDAMLSTAGIACRWLLLDAEVIADDVARLVAEPEDDAGPYLPVLTEEGARALERLRVDLDLLVTSIG